MADWQAIPYDPCTEKSPFHHRDLVYNNMTSLEFAEYNPPGFSLSLPVAATHSIEKREVIVLTNQQTLLAIEECENATFRGHPCHWIPKSSILPSYYCHDCQPICRSPFRSLNFIQFCIGFVLLFIFYAINTTSAAALLSDNASTDTQVHS